MWSGNVVMVWILGVYFQSISDHHNNVEYYSRMLKWNTDSVVTIALMYILHTGCSISSAPILHYEKMNKGKHFINILYSRCMLV